MLCYKGDTHGLLGNVKRGFDSVKEADKHFWDFESGQLSSYDESVDQRGQFA